MTHIMLRMTQAGLSPYFCQWSRPMTTDPTDSELDEWERDIDGHIPPIVHLNPVVAQRLIKALRACHQEAKAKDAVLAEIGEHWRRVDGWNFRPQTELPDDVRALLSSERKRLSHESVKAIRAALGNLPSVAKQGETDDAA